MATKEKFQNIWESVCNGTEKTIKFVFTVVGVVFVFIFLLAETLFIFNPIVFPFWAALFRNSFGEAICGECKNEIDKYYQEICQALLLWEIKLFPMWMKRQFIITDPQLFSCKNQVKVAHKLQDKAKQDFVGRMSEEAVRALWKQNNPYDRDAIIAKTNKLDEEMIEYLVINGKNGTLNDIIARTTLSSACIKVLMRYACQYDQIVTDPLSRLIFKSGLSADLIDYAFNLHLAPLEKLITDKLIIRNQSQMMDKFRDTEIGNELLWQKFCSDNEHICIEAEKKMQAWMFKEFYASGHKLSEAAQIHFFSDNNTKIAEIILTNEKRLSEKVVAVLRTNAQFYMLYLKLR